MWSSWAARSPGHTGTTVLSERFPTPTLTPTAVPAHMRVPWHKTHAAGWRSQARKYSGHGVLLGVDRTLQARGRHPKAPGTLGPGCCASVGLHGAVLSSLGWARPDYAPGGGHRVWGPGLPPTPVSTLQGWADGSQETNTLRSPRLPTPPAKALTQQKPVVPWAPERQGQGGGRDSDQSSQPACRPKGAWPGLPEGCVGGWG